MDGAVFEDAAAKRSRAEWFAGWIAAWRRISREQAIGAALLGVAAISPSLLTAAMGRFGILWNELPRLVINAEIWSFALLLCVVVADLHVDRGARRLVAYGVAAITAAALGVLLGLAHSHFVWDALRNPHAIIKAKAQVTPWVMYTISFSSFIETAMIGSLVTYLYADRREAQQMAQRVHGAQLRRADQAKAMLESQLQAMQARVEPQFLFDTLARIRQLYDVDAALAERMLDDLIAYLRAAMPTMRSASSTLGQETGLVRAYLNIVKTRLGERLTFGIELPDRLKTVRMPPMLLLPLIDDAVARLLDAEQLRATLRIRVESSDGTLRLVLDMRGELPRREPGTVVERIRDRLEALYGAGARIAIREIDERTNETIVEIPHEAIDGSDR